MGKILICVIAYCVVFAAGYMQDKLKHRKPMHAINAMFAGVATVIVYLLLQ